MINAGKVEVVEEFIADLKKSFELVINYKDEVFNFVIDGLLIEIEPISERFFRVRYNEVSFVTSEQGVWLFINEKCSSKYR
ncbi:hypothetical protein bcgnr5378_37150 [Bacillus cereus]|uniref:Uncharacterized protein n=1 Tax=Bacillus cereus TaxID=1396 RepID=A0A161TA38_BACCE|nr:hypothetical protein [Bacillus cereus]KZD71954.1 hypothetical protein B4088_0415 [Bacillus cereus]HDR8324513.1 hypothetical protein [Bacillus cereus]HDR8330565.1 hypothetical protein [Bacillus cereus]HDR8337468.1 hypothetical protein [Bacillus cereus]